MKTVRRTGPGLILAILVAGIAYALGLWIPVVGAPVFGIVIGIVVGKFWRPSHSEIAEVGYGFASKEILQGSIVVLGTGLSLTQIVQVGGRSLPVMIGTLLLALGSARIAGRRLGLPADVITLIGVGTAICGASAIAATSAVIKPKREDIAYAIGTIFTFNIAAVLAFPTIGHLLHMTGSSFGLWAGTAVNDTSSVVAAAYAFNAAAGPYAIVVKLVRTLMIIPIVVFLAHRRARTTGGDGGVSMYRIFPKFILLFLAAALLKTIGAIPSSWHDALSALGLFMITTALAAIGLSLRPAQMRAAGHRPLLLGALLWVVVAMSSLGLQALTGTV